jgi:hypothetical protein
LTQGHPLLPSTHLTGETSYLLPYTRVTPSLHPYIVATPFLSSLLQYTPLLFFMPNIMGLAGNIYVAIVLMPNVFRSFASPIPGLLGFLTKSHSSLCSLQIRFVDCLCSLQNLFLDCLISCVLLLCLCSLASTILRLPVFFVSPFPGLHVFLYTSHS